MTWEWVAPTATAAVGLAGIAATWLTARAGRIDQQNMVRTQYEQAGEAALRETRRNAYGALLADLYGTLQSAAFSDSVDYGNDVNVDADRVHALNLSRSLAEVKIVGTDMVRQLADTVTSRILIFKAQAIEGGVKSVSPDTSDALNEYLYLLERLMANDLGIPVSTKLEESDSVINVMYEASTILEHKRYLRQRVNDAMKKVNRED